MKRIVLFFSIAVFSIFLGSQITEGVLLGPFWETLAKTAFYEYYLKFGPIIARFYTMLTIIAVLIPLSISIYCFFVKSRALKYAVVSSFFALLIVAIFYIYFKNINQQFYQTAFDTNQLQSVLNTWEYMHWIRVLLEITSLIFLIVSLHILSYKKSTIDV